MPPDAKASQAKRDTPGPINHLSTGDIPARSLPPSPKILTPQAILLTCQDQQHLYHTMSEPKHAFNATNNANNKDEFHQFCLPDDILYRMMEEFESNVNEHSSRTDNARIVLTTEENSNDDRI